MKKFLALIVAAMLLLSATAALAEAKIEGETVTIEEPAYAPFSVTMVVPEEYTMEQYYFEGMLFVTVSSEAENTPNYIITVAPSEAYEGVTLNALTDEEKQELLATMDDDFQVPEVSDRLTDYGTQVYLINEVNPDSENGYFAAGFTIYQGYFIQIFAAKPNYEMLAKEDLDLAMALLSEMWFVE